MKNQKTQSNTAKGLTQLLSPRTVMAFAIGTSVGWGALIVTSNTYLVKAGPVGSIIGLIIGALIMILVSRNYHYLANQYPEGSGIYTYTKHFFGYDRAFLISWFVFLIYISMFWANATAVPLFARYIIGDAFRFGYLYSIFGYEVYLGEAILTVAVIALVTLLLVSSKRVTASLTTGLVLLFIIGITICFAFAMIRHGSGSSGFDPAFIPDTSPIRQIVGITFISPWAFIGFESVTQSSKEFGFKRNILFRILTVSIVIITTLYIFVTLLSVSAYPPEYDSWLSYINDLNNLSGIKALPAFYAAGYYLGNTGIVILFISLFALVATSLITNLWAISRLLHALGCDAVIPTKLAELNKKDIPSNAVLLVGCISLLIPFLGRTAIGWIVDITTVGATMLYGFVAAATLKSARKNHDKKEIVSGAIVLAAMLAFAVFLIIPGVRAALEPETYLLLVIWSILGMAFFRWIISKDHAMRFGKAIIVWIAFVSLIIFFGLVWMEKIEENAMQNAFMSLQNYYNGTAPADVLALDETEYIAKINGEFSKTSLFSIFTTLGLFVISVVGFISNYLSMKKYEAQAIRERDHARDAAYKDAMTGVKSKLAFAETESEINEKITVNAGDIFAVVVCDVNGLKHVNDTLGHKAGDQYICDASALICEYFKHSPVYRIGGDEFVVLLQGQDFDNREEILGELEKCVESNISTGKVVVSCGISVFRPGEDKTFHDVFERADIHMYQRKQVLKSMGAITRE